MVCKEKKEDVWSKKDKHYHNEGKRLIRKTLSRREKVFGERENI